MFKVITADNQQYYQAELHEMFSRRVEDELEIDSPVYDHQESVYIYFNDIKSGIYGSARLNPMTSKNLVCDKVGVEISPAQMETAWECSSLSFDIQGNSAVYECAESFDTYCTFYYKMLHATLISVCHDLNIHLLFLLNTSDEIRDMTSFGHIHFDKVTNVGEESELSLAIMTRPAHQTELLVM